MEVDIMKCPYCENKLTPGYIYGDRYALKWLPDNKKLTLGFAIGSETLPSSNHSLRPSVKTYKCNDCKKMIIDLIEEID